MRKVLVAPNQFTEWGVRVWGLEQSNFKLKLTRTPTRLGRRFYFVSPRLSLPGPDQGLVLFLVQFDRIIQCHPLPWHQFTRCPGADTYCRQT